jgi:hypothetical protein
MINQAPIKKGRMPLKKSVPPIDRSGRLDQAIIDDGLLSMQYDLLYSSLPP